MSRPLFVGNDVVDLDEPRVRGLSANARFVARVLAREEALVVVGASDPHHALWSIWAAKEAAFKVASKVRDAPPVFEHAAFVVSLPEAGTTEGPARVTWEDLRVAVTLHVEPDLIHAVGRLMVPPGDEKADERAAAARIGPPAPERETPADPGAFRIRTGVARLDGPGLPWAASLPELLPNFSEAERDPIHSRASAAVRLAARSAIASGLGIDEARLRIVCAPGPPGRRPPRVLVDDAPSEADVSLSHHGRWIAWAWSGPEPSRPPGT